MKNSEWVNYKIRVRDRLKVFALNILKLSDMLPKTAKARVINYQVTKSGTSEYANYRAALRGRSKSEFYSKLCISIEEADETEMWLDLIMGSNILDNGFIRELHSESLEIVKILSAMRRKTGVEGRLKGD